MALFDFLRKDKPQPKKRSYQAASAGRIYSDFVGSHRSPDSELRPVIASMRSRSRDLARNNEYVKRYLELLKTNVVGDKGFTLQVKNLDSGGNLDVIGNDAVEKAFKKWCKFGNCTVDGKMSFVDAQKLVIETWARDGEVFILKHRAKDFTDTFSLQFLEADYIDHDKNERLPNGNEIRMGIELDKYRRPVAYHMLTYHTGDYDYTSLTKSPKHVRVPAQKMIHLHLPLRAGQTRGEPWTSSSLPALKQLQAFREAAIVNARVGASKMGFFTSPAGDGFTGDDYENNVPIMEAEPGTFQQLPEGVSVQMFDPQFPNNEFDSFHKSVLKGIASGLGVSYTSLSNDLEATSYSSIRQGALEERDFYRNIQGIMISHFVRPAYEAWLTAAMEVESFGIPLAAYDKFADNAEFRGRAWNWVDPQKEMGAAIMGLKNGVLSLQDVAAQYGKDVEELLSQIKRDKNLMEQFGVYYQLEPYGAQFAPTQGETDEQDEDERNFNAEIIRALRNE
jgi:lambda family phage portal protein